MAHKNENLTQFQSSITFMEVRETFVFLDGWEEQGRVYSLGVAAG